MHQLDVRACFGLLQELEEGRTHDDLWNAAQLQLVKEGKLHGFLR
jgi:deoxyribodipyrimidine photo-lyase